MPLDKYQWHFDLEDRYVEPVCENDWKFQFDNELPMEFDSGIYIKSGRYHRVIPGTSDLYIKGAFFMHSPKTVLGDDVFFTTLKELANHPKYTYDNTVTTDDVEQLFTLRSGKNLKPFFDFYLRTTNKVNITIQKTDDAHYNISTNNAPIPLPIHIMTDSHNESYILEQNKPLQVKSKTVPVLDAEKNYLVEIAIN